VVPPTDTLDGQSVTRQSLGQSLTARPRLSSLPRHY